MKFISDFFQGIQYFINSSQLIFTKPFRFFLLYPLLAKLIFWIFAIWGIFSFNSFLKEELLQLLQLNGIPEKGSWLSGVKNTLHPHTKFLSSIISILTSVLIFIFLSTFNKYLLLILLSPILSIISERTEEEMTGNRYPFRIGKFLKDLVRGLTISIRNMLVEYIFFFLGFLLLFFPVAGFILFSIYQVFLIFLSWYYFGFALLDYSCERHDYGLRHSLSIIRKYKGIACGLGSIYWILISIPLFGEWIGICLAPAMGAIGSSKVFLLLINKENDEKLREKI